MKKISLFIIMLVLFITVNLYSLTPEDVMGKYSVEKVKEVYPDGSWLSVSLGSNDYGYGWFTLDRFRLKVKYSGDVNIDRDDYGTYSLSGNEISMTLDSGSNKDSTIYFENGKLIVETDYTNDPDKGFTLVITLQKISISNDQLCEEMGLGEFWDIDNNICSGYYAVKGWNLKSIPVKTNVNIDFFNNNCVNTIWRWDDNNATWQIWSPIESIMQIINNYKINKINSLKYGEGFWVNTVCTIYPNFNGENYNFSDITSIITNGWHLLGAGDNESVTDLLTYFPDVQTVWKWDFLKNSWEIWSNISSINELIAAYNIKTFNAINQGEGFWLKN